MQSVTKLGYLNYSVRVWLSSTLLPPLVIQIVNIFLFRSRSPDELPVDLSIGLLFPYVIGLVITLPYLVAFTLAVRYVDKTKPGIVSKKITLVILNAVMVTAHFIVVFQELLLGDDIFFLLTYLLISSISVVAFRIKDRKERTTANTSHSDHQPASPQG